MRRAGMLAAAALAVVATACSGGGTPAPARHPSSVTPASSPPSTTSPSPAQARPPDWPTYHGTNDRAGYAPGPSAHGRLRTAWSLRLDAAMYAQPIIADGMAIAATENDTVYAVSVTTGHVVWRTHLASPARRRDLPCGNIDPSGITGTPAYDAGTHQVFVVTEDSDARHALVAIDVRTGALRWRRDLDVRVDRDRHAEQVRGALLVAAGRVYTAFGGRAGDCGNYVGYVTAVTADGHGPVLSYAVPTQREAGMWAAPGPVAAPDGSVLVASGNGAEVGGRYDGSDSVIRLSPTLRQLGLFAPTSWRSDNEQDLDLGSMAPVVVGDMVVIAGKRGTVYLLATRLGGGGGIGGELATLAGCAGYGGGASHTGLVVLPCDEGLRALRVTGSSMHWLWHQGNVHGSPVIAGTTVYAFDDGGLVAISARDGHRIARLHVGDVTRFATPVPAGDLVVVGTKTHLVAVSTAR